MTEQQLTAMRQALNALKDYKKYTSGIMIPHTHINGDRAIVAIEAAIEQAKTASNLKGN